jgi:hypothetical protein
MKTLMTPQTQNGSDVLSIRNLTPIEISVKSADATGPEKAITVGLGAFDRKEKPM